MSTSSKFTKSTVLSILSNPIGTPEVVDSTSFVNTDKETLK